jgi:hypothetical protein
MFTLKRCNFTNHVLSDAPPVNDPTWECIESIVIFWIFGTIIGEL